jgi:hypothetical protein
MGLRLSATNSALFLKTMTMAPAFTFAKMASGRNRRGDPTGSEYQIRYKLDYQDR